MKELGLLGLTHKQPCNLCHWTTGRIVCTVTAMDTPSPAARPVQRKTHKLNPTKIGSVLH
eukprot:1906523-Amphidinium_carterae.1